ncbi:hypothetical protein [Frankia gtarii]|uniref:hypothetical protein n=1 Tax=Frankia gtarii TaxID=2950102 RepID=UPI0021BF0D91|nr:hypothetical protein [Frankia gtarii]
MAESAAVHHVHVTAAESEEPRVPADVAEPLGDDAQTEVGPGQVLTLRPGKLRSSALAVGVEPLDDSARLRYSANPLTSEERTALADFLAQ